MKFNAKTGRIVCSGRMMATLLEILTQQPGVFTPLHSPGWELASLREPVHKFRGGCTLYRANASEWYIAGGQPTHLNYRSARWELEAANHMRQAESLSNSIESWLRQRPNL